MRKRGEASTKAKIERAKAPPIVKISSPIYFGSEDANLRLSVQSNSTTPARDDDMSMKTGTSKLSKNKIKPANTSFIANKSKLINMSKGQKQDIADAHTFKI